MPPVRLTIACCLATAGFLAGCRTDRPPAPPPGLSSAEWIARPRVAAVAPAPAARLQPDALDECSGLVRSSTTPGLFWAHNDSGDVPRIFPIRRDGSAWGPQGAAHAGIAVTGAEARDWEDIASDGAGGLIIADLGNNENRRRDLTLIFIPEPDPADTRVAVSRRVRVHYPDQAEFPPPAADFDCEAIVWAGDRVHILTKHRSDSLTTLYRLDAELPFPESSPLTRIARFDVGGMVTAADTTLDGGRLAVLTYDAVWVFDQPAPGQLGFAGPVRWLPIRARQAEAIAWDGTDLLITNEQRDLFVMPVASLRSLR